MSPAGAASQARCVMSESSLPPPPSASPAGLPPGTGKRSSASAKKKGKSAKGGLSAAPSATRVQQYSPATKKMWILAFLVLVFGAAAVYFYLSRTAEPPPETHCVAVAAVNMAQGGLLSDYDPATSPIAFERKELPDVEPGVLTHPSCETLGLAMAGIEAPEEWLAAQPDADDATWQVFGTAPRISIYAGQQIRRQWFGSQVEAYLIGLGEDESVVRLNVSPANALLGAFRAGDRVDVVMPSYSGEDAAAVVGAGQAVIIARNLEIVYTTVDSSVFDAIQSEQLEAAAAGASYSVAGRLPVDAVPTTYILKADSTTALSLINAEVTSELHLMPASANDNLTVATAITALCLSQNSPLQECEDDPGVAEHQKRQRALRNSG